jgi:hypothetical protein
MAPFIIGRPDQKGSTGRDNRMVVEGVWDHAGSPWRDVPEGLGGTASSAASAIWRLSSRRGRMIRTSRP